MELKALLGTSNSFSDTGAITLQTPDGNAMRLSVTGCSRAILEIRRCTIYPTSERTVRKPVVVAETKGPDECAQRTPASLNLPALNRLNAKVNHKLFPRSVRYSLTSTETSGSDQSVMTAVV